MDNLFKAKIIMKNGVRYYADGKHAGKRVGSVRKKNLNSKNQEESLLAQRSARESVLSDISKISEGATLDQLYSAAHLKDLPGSAYRQISDAYANRAAQVSDPSLRDHLIRLYVAFDTVASQHTLRTPEDYYKAAKGQLAYAKKEAVAIQNIKAAEQKTANNHLKDMTDNELFSEIKFYRNAMGTSNTESQRKYGEAKFDALVDELESRRGSNKSEPADLQFYMDIVEGRIAPKMEHRVPKSKAELAAEYKRDIVEDGYGDKIWFVNNGKALGMSEDEIREMGTQVEREVKALKSKKGLNASKLFNEFKDASGGHGYINHESRSPKFDRLIGKVASDLGYKPEELIAFGDSRYGRWLGDELTGASDTEAYAATLKNLKAFKAED